MTSGDRRPALEHQPAPGPTRALAVFCHGGTVASVEPPKERALSLLRMRAIDQFVRASAAERGLSTYLLRYRVAGWNGVAADAHADVRWTLEELRERHGDDVPVVLVGHSMGGRAVLRAGGLGGDGAQVRAVCALAPWTPPGEPVGHL
ncbi:MAG: alpha/beta fold hydrolase, partial [Actinomycetota bacterium]|nr:alpha/beta fold hydrolase [Actinomycetota bacterium]